MKYIENLLEFATIGAGIYMGITAFGAALKTVQWIGKKLDVNQFNL